MSLTELEVKNFTVFADEKIPLKANVNVFIGSNGTGKTQLLKGIYGCCELSRTKDKASFMNCFQLDDLHHILVKDFTQGACHFILSDGYSTQKANVSFAEVAQDEKSGLRITDGQLPITYSLIYPEKNTNAVYIPVKDMLTHSKGLLTMSNRYKKIPFDKTLLDIIDRAQRWTVKNPSNLVKWLISLLEKCMDGKISIENDEFYLVKTDGKKVNFELEAEGFKKIGVLWQLLMNETLVPGSILLWDEPEANLNPEYIPVIADTLLALGRTDIQVFISTHSYMLAKYLDIRKKSQDAVFFHSLYRKDDSVYCETKKNFQSLKHNSIMKAYEALLDEVYEQEVGA